jgi:hypothetical protein
VKIETGVDLNGNGTRDGAEVVEETTYVCNGENGTNGSGGCAISGSGGAKGGIAGLFMLALIPAAVVVRRRLRN